MRIFHAAEDGRDSQVASLACMFASVRSSSMPPKMAVISPH